jgi:starvation-inducible DNA-binding protein
MSPVVAGLQQALANTVVLTTLTQAAHWNVLGADFFQLHKAFNGQYHDLFDLQDTIAERIRALDEPVKMCLTEIETQAGMGCMSSSFSARGMVDALITAHEKNVGDLKALCATARKAGDDVTENMALGWIEGEQKTLWMLKSYVK